MKSSLSFAKGRRLCILKRFSLLTYEKSFLQSGSQDLVAKSHDPLPIFIDLFQCNEACAPNQKLIACVPQFISNITVLMPGMKEPNSKELENKVTHLLGHHSLEEYPVVVAWQKALHEAVDLLVISKLEPVLNSRLAAMPQRTLEEKQTLCRWVNAELRSLKYSIKCPKTGLPAILHAVKGHKPDEGRFQIELLGGELGRRRTKTFQVLFPLEFVAEPSRNEPLAQSWSTKVSGERKRLPTNELDKN